jgi:hypothetical protein
MVGQLMKFRLYTMMTMIIKRHRMHRPAPDHPLLLLFNFSFFLSPHAGDQGKKGGNHPGSLFRWNLGPDLKRNDEKKQRKKESKGEKDGDEVCDSFSCVVIKHLN